jgi:hypothetical protein
MIGSHTGVPTPKAQGMRQERHMSTATHIWTGSAIVLTTFFITGAGPAAAQVVPGTGTLVMFDDFEDPEWDFTFNLPKSSKEEDEQVRFPLGVSSNNKWFESPKRGCPDVVRRVETPLHGIIGSQGSLYLRSRDTGVPGRPGFQQAQDDFIMKAQAISIANSPNWVVRVYLPPWNQWEQRTGVSFGLRAGVQGPHTELEDVGRWLFRRKKSITEIEPYYPGIFIQYNCARDKHHDEDHALFVIRAGNDGQDVVGPRIRQTGWWTLGMSITPDSRVHYYARPGVGDLTSRDLMLSTTPYGRQAQYFNTIFFDVCNMDNGTSWTTPWIIDDPAVYSLGGSREMTAGRRGNTSR